MALLTYEPFYRLKEKPFSLAADPAFFYKSAGHRAAFEAIGAGIRRREGLIVLSGAIGTGKTTVCRAVVSQLDQKTFATFVPDPFVTREDLLKTMLVGFGIVSVAELNAGRLHGASRQDLSYPLYEFLDSLVPLQAYAVLVIDEAQNLSLGVMEEIRILAELEKREKMLQVVLVGQPELRDNLRLPQMRQVEQRVTVRCELGPLAFPEVVDYVSHRLGVAAEQTADVEFTGGALEAVHLASGGVPRLINLLCDRSLQRGFDAQRKTIDRDTVMLAGRDLGLGDRVTTADVHPSTFVLPLPFEEQAAPPPPIRLAATPRPAPANATTEFPPEPAAARPHPAASNALAEFDAEPQAAAVAAPPAPPSMAADVRGRTLFSTVVRALGLATAALGITIGAGVLDTRAAFDTMSPNRMPALPAPADRRAAATAHALRAPDALAAALTDGHMREADGYMVQVASFHSRAAADGLVSELGTQGFRGRWVEVRIDADAEQQVFVDGYGTLEDALVMVGRLRRQPASAAARLFKLPGANSRSSS